MKAHERRRVVLSWIRCHPDELLSTGTVLRGVGELVYPLGRCELHTCRYDLTVLSEKGFLERRSYPGSNWWTLSFEEWVRQEFGVSDPEKNHSPHLLDAMIGV